MTRIAALRLQAYQQLRAGDPVAAEASCRQVLRQDPWDAETNHLLGVILVQGSPVAGHEALRRLSLAARARPERASIRTTLATALQLHDSRAAIHQAHRGLALAPLQVALHHALGAAWLQLGHPAEAAKALARAVRLDPARRMSRLLLSQALLDANHGDKAIMLLEAALRDQPGDSEWLILLGRALLSEADRAQPASAVVNRRQAVNRLQAALATEPRSIPAMTDLARVTDKYPAPGAGLAVALTIYRRALALTPADFNLRRRFALALQKGGMLNAADALFREALAVGEPGKEARWRADYLFFMNYLPDMTDARLFAETRRWATEIGPATATAATAATATAAAGTAAAAVDTRVGPAAGAIGRRRSTGRIRLAYVSPEFRRHPFLDQLEPVLTAQDRTSFERHLYAMNDYDDRHTDRVRALADRWVDARGLSPDALAKRFDEDGIDVAIHLTGWHPRHRLPFTRRLAPLQVAYINHLGSTGLTTLDIRITDDDLDPPGQTETFNTERLVRLSSGFACWRPPADAPAVSPLPASRHGYVTFGSFNNITKITDAVLALWAELLAVLPDSRLLLKAPALSDDDIATLTRRRAARQGIDPARLDLRGGVHDYAAHLGVLGEADIALDCFPFAGGLTSYEVLWMGVPVITLPGATVMSRVGASTLRHAGLPDGIAASPRDYVARALRLSEDLPALAERRATLRRQLRQSTLLDAATHTRELEAVLHQALR